LRHRIAALAIAALAIAGLAVPVAPAARAAVSADPKVVIIVGATHSATSNYRTRADVAAAEAAKYTKNVVKIYSPNATWAAVKSALQGASVVLYLGHGNGFPSPYRSSPWPYSQNGFGLNKVAGQGDSNTTYYGEAYIAAEIRLAPNAVVILNHLCYASGNSEPGNPEPTVSVAHQRIDNYAAGFLKAGARAVLAEAHIGADWWMRTLFTTRQTIEQAWRNAPYGSGHIVSFASSRSPGYTAFSDPTTPTSGFYRSMVGQRDLTTTQVTGGRFADTGADPADFVVPGAASVATDGATVFASPPAAGTTLAAASSATLPAGTRLRVVGEADTSAADRVLQVETLDGTVGGYMRAADLVPRDSLSPVAWGIPDEAVFTPNGDGIDDVLQIAGTLSESARWTFRIQDGGGVPVLSASGTSASVRISWDGKTGGSPVPDGAYRWSLTAADAWGNAPLSRVGLILVDRRPEARLGGADRFATAAMISRAVFAPGVPVAYVATGLNFPDALAGAAAAGKVGAPVLLVQATSIPGATKTELDRLDPARIVVLGGASVIDGSVLTALKSFTTGPVIRVAGSDRYATAAAASASTFDPGVPVAFVATGRNFPDALAGAAAAAKLGGPVLLVEPDAIPEATAAELGRLKPGRIVIVGSTGVVSGSVAAALDAYTTGPVSRLAGADRYATAAAISQATFAPGVPIAYVATGLNFPDALAGAAAAGKVGAPVLLVTRSSIPPVIIAELKRLKPARIVILGATGVVSDQVKIALGAYETP
jgi:putative cell wall-binding protein